MASDVGGELKYIITADTSDFEKKLEQAGKEFDSFAKQLDNKAGEAGNGLKKSVGDASQNSSREFRKFVDDSLSALGSLTKALGKVSFNAFTTAAGAASTAMTAMVGKGINIGSSLEKNRLSFEALTGSVEKAETVLTSVANFASENPYQLLDVSNVARELVAMGRSADQVEGDLAKLGAIGVATGADLQGLGHVYGQISAQGRMMTQDMYQLVNQGVAIMPALSKVTGKSMTELKDYISSGQVTMEVFEKAMTQIVDPKMYDNLLNKMNNTIPRQLDRLKGSISTFATSLVGIDKWTGQKLDNGLAQTYTNLLRKLADQLRNPQLIASVQKLGQAIAKLIDKFLPLIDKIAPALTKAFDMLSEHTEMLLPIVGGALVVFGKLGAGLPGIGGIIGNLSSSIGGLKTEFVKLFKFNPLLGAFVTMLAVGLPKALGNESVRASISKLVSSLGKLAQALVPVITNIASIMATAGSKVIEIALKAITPLIEGLANVISSIPTPVLTAIISGLLGFVAIKKIVGPVSKATSALSGLGSAVGGGLGKSVGSGIVGLFSTLGSGLGAIAKGALALTLIGAAVGVFIAAVGGGIWVFGEGLKAIGEGLGSVAKGATKFAKSDVDGLAKNVDYLVKALSGLIWHAWDLGTAAMTFSGIGSGLKLIAEGCEELDDVNIRTIKNKLPALGDALKSFQIGFWENVFGGNILSKFKDLGDAVKNVADLINVIAEIKISNEKMKNNMQALADGLRSFLMPEFQPGFITSVFVGKIEVNSILDKFKSLGEIIKPLGELINLMEDIKIKPDKLKENLENVADGLKAFLLPQFKPSWLASVFGAGTIDYVSVTDYLGSLGNIIEPLNKLYALFNQEKFDGDKFSGFIDSLAKALQSFIVTDLSYKFSFLASQEIKTEHKSITEMLGGLGNVVTALNELNNIFSKENFKSEEFTTFVESLGEALNSFITIDIDSTTSQFLGKTKNLKTNTTSILEHMKDFGSMVDGVNKLSSMFNKDAKIDTNALSSFIGDLGKMFKEFEVFNEEAKSSGWGFESGKSKTYTNILEHLGNFKDFVEGVAKLIEITKDEKLNVKGFKKIMNSMKAILDNFSKENSEISASALGIGAKASKNYTNILEHIGNFADFCNGVATLIKTVTETKIDSGTLTTMSNVLSTITGALNGAARTLNSEEINVWGIGGKTTETLDSVFSHLSDFSTFVSGVSSLIKTISENKFDVAAFDSMIDSLTKILTSAMYVNSEAKADGSVLWGLVSVSAESKKSLDSVFSHLQHFQLFAEGVKTITDAICNENFNVETFKSTISSLSEILKSTMGVDETGKESLNIFLLFSSSKEYESKLTSVFEHMSHFKDFAEGIKTIADVICQQDFNIDDFKSSLTNIFEALKTLILQEGEISNESGSWFGSGSETTKFSYTSVIEKLGDIKNLADAISTFVNTVGLGKADSGFDGAKFKTDMSNIGNGFRDFVNAINQSEGLADVEEIGKAAEGVKKWREVLEGWNTENLPLIGTNIGNLIKNVVDSFPSSVDELTVKFTAFTTFLEDTKTKLLTFASDMEVSGRNILDSFFTGLNANFEQYKNDFWDSIKALLDNAGNADQQTNAKNVGSTLASKIADGFKNYDFSSKGSTIGTQLTSGFEAGVAATVWRINSAMGKISTAAIGTLKSLLGIHSPSVEFYKLGAYTAEGWVEGFKDQYKEVAKAAQGMADIIREPFDELNGLSVSIAGQAGEINGGANQYNKNLTVNQNNTINNGIDYNTMMADLRWELFTA